MEGFIRTLVTTRKEFPLLTENIRLLHENPRITVITTPSVLIAMNLDNRIEVIISIYIPNFTTCYCYY